MANMGKQYVSSRQGTNLGQRKSIFEPSKFPQPSPNINPSPETTDLSGYRQPQQGEMMANVMDSLSTSKSASPPNYLTGKQLPAPKRQEREVNMASVNQLKAPPRQSNLSENPIQKQEESIPNQTGLPDNLKAGIENLSGYSLDNVRVHYNSSKPAQLQALAYTQGTEIHVAPGQEEHLPHEAWHVVQQMQGRVKPTMQMKGLQVNDDEGLEREADAMGRKVDQVMEKELQVRKPKKLQIPLSKPIGNVLQGFRLGDRPFEEAYSSLTNSSTWFNEAKEYEQRLGSYAYHHQLSNDALNAGINKMETVLTNYYQEENTQEEIYRAFFKDDPGSAGQVGLNLDINRMTQVLHHGNLRERMTAFYNAAYYAGGTGNDLNIGFKALLHDLVFKGQADLGNDLDLDRDTLQQQISFYTSYLSGKGWGGYLTNLVLWSIFKTSQSGKDIVNKVAIFWVRRF